MAAYPQDLRYVGGTAVDAATGVPVTLVAGSAVVGTVAVQSTGYSSQATVTRPANTTAYAAGDVVGGAITFTTAGPSAGYLYINSADLLIEVNAVPSGMTTFRLYLYSVTPPSAIADNSPFDLGSADWASYLGYIDLGTPADLGSALLAQAPAPAAGLPAPGLLVKLASTSLFGYLVTAGGFTPAANSEVYLPRIKGVGV